VDKADLRGEEEVLMLVVVAGDTVNQGHSPEFQIIYQVLKGKRHSLEMFIRAIVLGYYQHHLPSAPSYKIPRI
jgi:hypothetical protein